VVEKTKEAKVSSKSQPLNKDTPTAVVATDDEARLSVSIAKHIKRDHTFTHSETAQTTYYDHESRSEKTFHKRERFNRIVAKLTSKRNRVEVYSRTSLAWFPCVVRAHSHTARTVAVVYHNGTDTVVKLLDPESPLIRIVQGPIYSIYCLGLEKMYSNLCMQIKMALQFRKVNTDGKFYKKNEHFCFSGQDLVLWLRTVHLRTNALEEDGVMAQLGNELLARRIIYMVKRSPQSREYSQTELLNPTQETVEMAERKDSDEDPTIFSSKYLYALNEWSVIARLIEKENLLLKQQNDRLWWATKSHLEVFSSSTNTWELGTVVAALDPWLLLVYGQEAQAARAKWIHRLDYHTVRHPRFFWRNGSQIWVYSRGDDEWFAGFVSNRMTPCLGDPLVSNDESIVNVMYGPTDSMGAFTKTKHLKLDSDHIRPRVARLSRMCICVRSAKGEPLLKLDQIKQSLKLYSKCKEGQRPFNDAQPSVDCLLMVCPSVEMTVYEREQETKRLSTTLGFEVKIDVVPWELFTAGRDVLYNLQKATVI